MTQPGSISRIDRAQLEQELEQLRHSSLIAARRGDYRRVARLTAQVIRLTEALSARAFDGHEIDLGLGQA